MFKTIFTSLLLLIHLMVQANPIDTTGQSIMFTNHEIRQINLHLSKSTGDPEMRSNAILGLVTGAGFITMGAILEANRISRNQPNIHGYNASYNSAFNWSVIGIGTGFSIGSVYYLIKSYR